MNHRRTKILFLSLASTLVFAPLLLEAGTTPIRTASGRVVQGLPNQVLVRFKNLPGVRAESLSRFNIKARRTLAAINVDLVPVPAGESLQSFISKLEADPNVEFAEPNGIVKTSVAPNDPDYSGQYSLAKINVETAWGVTTGVSTVVVAVVDSGVDLTHQDLSANLWVNPNPSGNSGLHGTRLEVDFDGNGDCTDTNTPIVGDDQCASSDPSGNDSPEFHGTRVAGIIAATTDNNLNIAGVARGCRIMAVKSMNSTGYGTFESIANGVLYAADNGAAVINLSLGSESPSDTLAAAVNYALKKNIVVVAAAGNLGSFETECGVNYPAAIPRVIAVSATDSADRLADFSCTGPEVDVAAPGKNIRSTIPTNATSTDGDSGNDGTSFAAPIVSGIAALLRSLNPSMSVDDVTRYIDYYAVDVSSTGRFSTSFGYGRVDAGATLLAAQNGTPFVTNPLNTGDTFPQPNPFNPTLTSVNISIPSNLGSESIEIRIFNAAGEKVKTLNGTNVWDGKNEDGNYVASGFYYYFLKTSKGDMKGKMTVIK